MKKITILLLLLFSITAAQYNTTLRPGIFNSWLGLNNGLYLISNGTGLGSSCIITPNADTTIIGGYFAVNTTNTQFGLASGDFEFLLYGQIYRIRQNCLISKLQIYVNDLTDVTGLYLKIWQFDGADWTLISKSENFLSQVTAAQISTIRFAVPIQAYDGNFYSILSTGTNGNEFQVIADADVSMPYLNREAANNEAWNTGGGIQFALKINMFTTPAPVFVFIGNSLCEVPDRSYISVAVPPTVSTNGDVYFFVSDSLNYAAQNMGIASQTSTQGLARFQNDVINLHPKVAVIEFLLNDIFNGVTIPTIVANYNAMLDSCVLHNIYPVIWLPTAWTNGTNAQMLDLDDAASQIKSLAAIYNAGVADDGPILGIERDTGTPTPTAGNHWNLQGIYTTDGTHRNAAGNALTAGLIDSVILTSFCSYTPYPFVLRNLVPALTSDSSYPPILITASSQLENFEKWRAFDADLTTPTDCWVTDVESTGWIMVDFGHDTTLASYAIIARGFGNFDFKSWILTGSVNAFDWVLLDTQTDVAAWSELERRYYTITPATYRYFLFTITANQGGAYLDATQIQLYGY